MHMKLLSVILLQTCRSFSSFGRLPSQTLGALHLLSGHISIEVKSETVFRNENTIRPRLDFQTVILPLRNKTARTSFSLV